jgi:hypothetical protein
VEECKTFPSISADYNDVEENYLALAYYMDALEIFKMSQEVRWFGVENVASAE